MYIICIYTHTQITICVKIHLHIIKIHLKTWPTSHANSSISKSWCLEKMRSPPLGRLQKFHLRCCRRAVRCLASHPNQSTELPGSWFTCWMGKQTPHQPMGIWDITLWSVLHLVHLGDRVQICLQLDRLGLAAAHHVSIFRLSCACSFKTNREKTGRNQKIKTENCVDCPLQAHATCSRFDFRLRRHAVLLTDLQIHGVLLAQVFRHQAVNLRP